jgi:hypothetical protein
MEVLEIYLKGFDNYQVSNLRNVRSEKGKEFRLLKGLNNGYEMCTIPGKKIYKANTSISSNSF